jgi:hypothetical protein
MTRPAVFDNGASHDFDDTAVEMTGIAVGRDSERKLF